MDGHTSDCALNNSPAEAPQACSCGTSQRFRVFEYDINHDSFRWRLFSRETAITEVVCRALARVYGQQKVVRTSTLISRALRDGLTPNEQACVTEAWRQFWADRDPAFEERTGHRAFVSNEDGAYWTDEQIEAVRPQPDQDEVMAAIAPWLDYWSGLPEPVNELRAVFY